MPHWRLAPNDSEAENTQYLQLRCRASTVTHSQLSWQPAVVNVDTATRESETFVGQRACGAGRSASSVEPRSVVSALRTGGGQRGWSRTRVP
jgi:hypothetical protein